MSRENEGKLTKSIFTTSQTIQDHTKLQCCPAYRITLKIGPRSLETDMSLSLFPSSSTSSSSSLSRRWRMPLVLGSLRLQQVLIKPRKTAAVHWRQSEGGLLSLVNTCGETGLCPPCTEAHPPWRVGPPRAVGGGRGRTRGVAALHPPGREEGVLPARWVSF